MTRVDELVEVGAWQAGYCRELGAPTWAAVIDAVTDDLVRARDRAATRLLIRDAGAVRGSMVWLRFLGSIHRLVLDDPTCEPARWFATTGGRVQPAAAVAVVLPFVSEHEARLRAEMAEPVQTNEVARGAPLSAAMAWLGGPLHLRELGASAGLNLWLDRLRVVGDGFAWGPPDSPLVLEGMVASGRPEGARFEVLSRAGCDRTPRDPHDQRDRRVLRSFVWPDHPERLARLDAAMAVAGDVRVERCELVSWVCEQLRTLGVGRTVVYHSIVTMYLEPHERDALRRELSSAGERADDAHRLAHVSLELGGDDTELVVARWPEADVHRLATTNPHGADIAWRPTRVSGP